MSTAEYYIESISESFDEHGITATKKQIASVAKDFSIMRENESMMFGYDCIPNPLKLELEELKRKHSKELRETTEQYEEIRKDLNWDKRHLRSKLYDALEEIEELNKQVTV